MELKLKKEEGIILDYDECPRCHRTFNSKKRKKTQHHALPKFLKPKTEIKINLCLECHNELNSNYSFKSETMMDLKYGVKTESFGEFIEKYKELSKNYHNKKLNRGQFGEGLWVNLTSYLEKIQ